MLSYDDFSISEKSTCFITSKCILYDVIKHNNQWAREYYKTRGTDRVTKSFIRYLEVMSNTSNAVFPNNLFVCIIPDAPWVLQNIYYQH